MFSIPYPTPPHQCPLAKDDDLKSQVEKLWREVNALKEMQALQTGERSPSPAPGLEGSGRERGIAQD
jgi:hypothetical protein